MKEDISIFSVINPHFFGLLTGKNKANNFRLLVQTDIFFGSQFSLDRGKLVDNLSEYIKNSNLDDVGDIGESSDHEEGLEEYLDDGEGDVYQKKASAFVHAVEVRGWLDRDTDKRSFESIVTRTDAFVAVMKALTDLISEEIEAKEEARYIVSLYDQVQKLHQSVFGKHKSFDGTYVGFQNIDETSKNLEKELLSVNSRIKRFVAKVMRNTNMGEKDLLKTLTIDYQKLGAYIAFHNLMTKYNPNKFSSDIVSWLQELRNPEIINGLSDDYFKTKSISVPTVSDKDEAKRFFESIIESVIYQMDGIEDALETISSRNQAYVSNSAERIKFRLNNERDVKKDINDILKEIKLDDIPSEEEIGDCFELYCYKQLDNKSSFAPRKISKAVAKTVPFRKREPSLEAKKRAEELIRQQNLYSVDAINKFVSENLGEKSSMQAKDIKVDDEISWIRLMLIPIFSSNGRAIYEIGPEKESKFECRGYLINNYDIRRKEKKHD